MGNICAALLVILAFTPLAVADVLELNDGNLIECKLIRKEKTSRGEMLVVADENGKERQYDMRRVKTWIETASTSWEIKAKQEAWYAKKVQKVKDKWKPQETFARKCYRENLPDRVIQHNLRAYELRKAKTKPDQDSILKLALWLDKLALYGEAIDERREVYGLRKEKVADTVSGHLGLAKWATRWELLEEAVEQYEAVLVLDTSHRRATKMLDKVSRLLRIPMDAGLYRQSRVRVSAAADYLRGEQHADGSFGSDLFANGVHGLRGMTALATMALLADWDFGVLSGKYEADEVPEEVFKALEFLKDATKTEDPRLQIGVEVWGPIFSLDLFVQCYRREQFADMKESLAKDIDEFIAELAPLQRSDGGWYYYGEKMTKTSAGFVTASVLLSMIHAANTGFDVDRTMISRGAQQIESLRQGHGTFTYSPGLTQGPVGACARSPLCELALNVAGVGKESSLKYAIENFFNNRHILERLKGMSGTHIGAGKTAPYYLLFAHYWTARAIKHLPMKQQRKYLNGLGGGLVAYQERDGTFGDWTGTKDYRVYGTAFASLTLYYVSSLKAVVGEIVDEEPRDPGEGEEAVTDGEKDGKPSGENPTDKKPTDKKPTDKKPTDKKPIGKDPSGEEPEKGQGDSQASP